MGFAFHQLCLRYSGTLTPTAPKANRLWETFTFLNLAQNFISLAQFNPIALKAAKTLWSSGHSECNRVNKVLKIYLSIGESH